MKQLKQIICCYSGCEIRLPDLIKACHHCNAAYCSSRCRQLDWEAHKHVCFIGLLNSDCKRILAKVNRNTALRNELSKLARTAYLGTLQRGFVWLDYLSNESAQDFLVKHDVSDDLSNFLMFFGNNLLPKYVCFDPNQLVYKKPANMTLWYWLRSKWRIHLELITRRALTKNDEYFWLICLSSLSQEESNCVLNILKYIETCAYMLRTINISHLCAYFLEI